VLASVVAAAAVIAAAVLADTVAAVGASAAGLAARSRLRDRCLTARSRLRDRRLAARRGLRDRRLAARRQGRGAQRGRLHALLAAEPAPARVPVRPRRHLGLVPVDAALGERALHLGCACRAGGGLQLVIAGQPLRRQRQLVRSQVRGCLRIFDGPHVGDRKCKAKTMGDTRANLRNQRQVCPPLLGGGEAIRQPPEASARGADRAPKVASRDGKRGGTRATTDLYIRR